MLRQRSIVTILFIALFVFGASVFAQDKTCASDDSNCAAACASKSETVKDAKASCDSKMTDKAACESKMNDKKCDQAKCDAKKDGKKCDTTKCEAKKDGKKCDTAKCEAKKDGKKCDPAKCEAKNDGKKCDPAKCDSKMADKKDAKSCDSKMTDKKETKNEKTAAKAWNKVCPVMGEEVDADAPTTTYKGKVIGFCCAGCDKKFQKDPERYMKNLSEDGTKFLGSK